MCSPTYRKVRWISVNVREEPEEDRCVQDRSIESKVVLLKTVSTENMRDLWVVHYRFHDVCVRSVHILPVLCIRVKCEVNEAISDVITGVIVTCVPIIVYEMLSIGLLVCTAACGMSDPSGMSQSCTVLELCLLVTE